MNIQGISSKVLFNQSRSTEQTLPSLVVVALQEIPSFLETPPLFESCRFLLDFGSASGPSFLTDYINRHETFLFYSETQSSIFVYASQNIVS